MITKYVKIYNEKMQCLGVADIEQNYDKDGYVKLFDATTMRFRGVVDVDDIPESGDNMPVVKVFDEDMQPCGVVTADNIRHSDGYLIRLRKDPAANTGTVTGGGRFIAGTSVTVVATPDAQSEYPEFDGWYEGETKVSENASYTFTVSGARTLVAKFKEATPTPLPVESEVQVFANPECTEYATGEVDTVYVRINTPWSGLDSGWAVGQPGDDGSCFVAYSPVTGSPEEAYSFGLWIDFIASTDGPYTAGQVVEAVNESGVVDVTDYTKIFFKP